MQSDVSARAACPNATATTIARLDGGTVLAVLNEPRDSLPACPHCRERRIQRWGQSGGVQRFRCKACTRSFNALTGTPLARLRRRDLWLDYAQALNDGLSIRAAGRRLGIHYNTTFRWRHRWLIHPATCRDTEFQGIIEVETVAFVDVSDGEQSWRRVAIPPPVAERPSDLPPMRNEPQAPCDHSHHPEATAGKAPPIVVLVARDRRGATTDAVLDALDQPSVASVLDPILDPAQTMLCTPDLPLFAGIADAWQVAHYPAPRAASFAASGVFHRLNVQGYVHRLDRWLQRFLGVSARYLGHYLGWRRQLDRHRRPPPPLTWLRLALGRDQQPTMATRQAAAA